MMKNLTSHTHSHGCALRYSIQCKVCVRVYLMTYLHAKSCTRHDCPVLYCHEVRAALHEDKAKVSCLLAGLPRRCAEPATP